MRNATRQACTCAHATAQLLRASLHRSMVFVYSREETGSKFDLLFEVIFKDLAVPAASVKLTLGSWFQVLAVAMHVLLILGSEGKLCS